MGSVEVGSLAVFCDLCGGVVVEDERQHMSETEIRRVLGGDGPDNCINYTDEVVTSSALAIASVSSLSCSHCGMTNHKSAGHM